MDGFAIFLEKAVVKAFKFHAVKREFYVLLTNPLFYLLIYTITCMVELKRVLEIYEFDLMCLDNNLNPTYNRQ